MRRQWLLIWSFSVTLHAGVILLLGLIPSRPVPEAESDVIELMLVPAEESDREDSRPEITAPPRVARQPEPSVLETPVEPPPTAFEMPDVVAPVEPKAIPDLSLATRPETVSIVQAPANVAAIATAHTSAGSDGATGQTGAKSEYSARLQTFAQPNYGRNPPPAYPAQARRRRQQGTVLLGVIVTTNGAAGAIKVKRSSGFRVLDESAVQAVRRWTFSPARLGDDLVESEVELPITFSLP